MRNGLMGLVGVMLAGCAPTVAPKQTNEVITVSSSGSIHGETDYRLYSDNVLVESGWELTERGQKVDSQNFKRSEQLRDGAFDAVLHFLRDEPFMTKEDSSLEKGCWDSPTIVISYTSLKGEDFEYSPPCWDDDIGPYQDKIHGLIDEYRVKYRSNHTSASHHWFTPHHP